MFKHSVFDHFVRLALNLNLGGEVILALLLVFP